MKLGRRIVKICFSEAEEGNEENSKIVENFVKEFGLEIKIEKGSSKVMLEALENTKSSYHSKSSMLYTSAPLASKSRFNFLSSVTTGA